MIKTEGLTRHFGETVAVEDLTVHVKKGEVFGFLGPNGAGKTTTIRMLCCLISKTKGEAYVDGLNTSDKKDALKIRQIVGLLPEATGLYERLSAYILSKLNKTNYLVQKHYTIKNIFPTRFNSIELKTLISIFVDCSFLYYVQIGREDM